MGGELGGLKEGLVANLVGAEQAAVTAGALPAGKAVTFVHLHRGHTCQRLAGKQLAHGTGRAVHAAVVAGAEGHDDLAVAGEHRRKRDSDVLIRRSHKHAGAGGIGVGAAVAVEIPADKGLALGNLGQRQRYRFALITFLGALGSVVVIDARERILFQV